MNERELVEAHMEVLTERLIKAANKVGENNMSPLYDHGDLMDKVDYAKRQLINQVHRFVDKKLVDNYPLQLHQNALEPITPDEFERLLMAFEARPYIPEYKQVMDAYRAVCHYATWNEDENHTWTCDPCGAEWSFEDATPKDIEVNYCPTCGAYIEAFIKWEYEAEE